MLAKHRDVSRAAEDKLTYRLGLAAAERCQGLIDAYNQCMQGRTLSAVWACKAAHSASQRCLDKYVNERSVAIMSERWLAAGRPKHPDWDALMAGLLDDPPAAPS